MRYSFDEKRIVLTGASSGIGEALAYQLAAEGARLVLAARTVDKLEKVAQRCKEAGTAALVVPTDVSQEDQCNELISIAVDKLVGLDGIILNAGVSMWARFDDVTDSSIFRRLMAVNYFGTLYCLRAALPHLKETQGRIAAMSSAAAKTGAPLHSGYAASKHALTGLLESLRTELVGSGIRITLLYPEFVRTEIRLHGFQGDGTRPTSDPYDDRAGMSAEETARITLRAIRKGKREELFIPLMKIGHLARPFIPGVIDSIARKKVGLA